MLIVLVSVLVGKSVEVDNAAFLGFFCLWLGLFFSVWGEMNFAGGENAIQWL